MHHHMLPMRPCIPALEPPPPLCPSPPPALPNLLKASTVTELVTTIAWAGVATLNVGTGLISPSRTYVLHPLGGTTGQAVVQRINPDGSLGAIVWQSNWPGALTPVGGSTLGEWEGRTDALALSSQSVPAARLTVAAVHPCCCKWPLPRLREAGPGGTAAPAPGGDLQGRGSSSWWDLQR